MCLINLKVNFETYRLIHLLTVNNMALFCSQCGRKPTTKEGKNGVKRTIDPLIKICNECEPSLSNTITGAGGAIRRTDSSHDNERTDASHMIPEEILNKTGADLSATDMYKIVSAAMHETNQKIDKLDEDIHNKMVTLENSS